MNFKQAAVHIIPARQRRTDLTVVTGQVAPTYRCARCRRDLPDEQFHAVDYGRRSIMYLHPLCNRCRKQLRSRWTADPLYSPAMHRFLSDVARHARGGAQRRGILFALTDDDVVGLYVEQKGRCALTGSVMQLKRGVGRRNPLIAGIDRIDSRGNYTLDNVQMVCGLVNLMKGDLTVEQFRYWCAKVILAHDDEIDQPEAE